MQHTTIRKYISVTKLFIIIRLQKSIDFDTHQGVSY